MRKRTVPQPVKKGKKANVPFIMQMETMECGAASLGMILAYYGKWVPLEQLRVDCGVSRDGSSARNLLRAAKHYGLDCEGFRLEPEMLRDEGIFPCIAHIDFTHFVVVTGMKGEKVYLNDPAQGKIMMELEQFGKHFTGVALLFEPTEEFEPGGQPASIRGFVMQRLRGTGSILVATVLASVISSVVKFITPAFSKVFYDYILGGNNPDWIYALAAIMGILACIEISLTYIQTVHLRRLEGQLSVMGSSDFFWHILNLPLDFFSQRMSGDIMQRQEDNAAIAGTLVNTLAPQLLNVVLMFAYFFLIWDYSSVLTCIGLTGLLVNAGISRLLINKRMDILRKQQRDNGRQESSTLSGIGMMDSIKASGAENGFFTKWSGYQAAMVESSNRAWKSTLWIDNLTTMISKMVDLFILGTGAFLTFQGHFTVGMLMAFQGLIAEFSSPVLELIHAGQSLQEMRVEMERVNDILKYRSDEKEQRGKEAVLEGDEQKLSGILEMRNVSFGYSPLGEPIVKDLSFSLKPGKRVALVGTSGCGKSTAAKLLAGLYKPWSGEILYDGHPIQDIPRTLFGGSVAVVDQDVILFRDTIRNNIKMWDSSIEDFEMILAARDAGLHGDIMQRKGGYDSVLTENGRDLSGGQRQRMEIARVLAQDPTILIMDEATSALDARTEYEVMNAVRDRGIACVIIAHRLSTIRDCDEILVMKHGEVVERGTHEELYQAGGVYTELISSD